MFNLFDKYKKCSYSQSGEDLIIDFIFNGLKIEKPSYLDIGAYHPYHYSNTAFFYKKGGRGINIEPNKKNFDLFLKYRKKDINLNLGIAKQEGVLNFYHMSVPTLNTFSETEAYRLEKEFNYKILNIEKIKVKTIEQVINSYWYGKFPDFLSLDVEGGDEDIIKSINYDNGPIVICVETILFSDSGKGIKNMSMIDFLKSKGYLVYGDTYINTIFVKKDKWIKRNI